MIVDELRARELDAVVERSARVRWQGADFRLRITVPADHAPASDEASAFLAATLLPAMHLREDLEIDGVVSSRLLRRSDLVQSAYLAWNPALRRSRVRARMGGAEGRRGRGEVAAFFSRGVDSTYTATSKRVEPGPLDSLVYCETLEIIHDERVRAEELRLAREAAELVGLPLVTVNTNVREMTYPWLSWGDVHGAALAFIALSLAGRLRHVVVPSSDSYANLAPHGSSPVLDPLFSTEALDIEHDTIAEGRLGKVNALAAERPELLPYLKVCYTENRPDNCGRCGKCLWTMACLCTAGVLEYADGFPKAIDVRAVRRIRGATLNDRLSWAEIAQALEAGDGDGERLRRAILHALRRSARPSLADRLRSLAEHRRGERDRLDPTWNINRSAFRRHWTNMALSLLRDGRPYR